jgi:hypothetical protein
MLLLKCASGRPPIHFTADPPSLAAPRHADSDLVAAKSAILVGYSVSPIDYGDKV